MRLPRGWDPNLTPDDLTSDEHDTICATLNRSFELGINHVETARGYMNSERWLGFALREHARDKYILQTKVDPKENPKDFEHALEQSLQELETDYLDLFGFHGINDSADLERVIRKGGCLEVVRRWQKDGRIRHVGFSTHGACQAIIDAIDTGEFDYVNLHWYFINQTNWPAIEAAAKQDMGVFIISPTDKGGQLFKPPAKLVETCAPLHPISFNNLFCLKQPKVHTLSVGAACPEDFDEHIKGLQHYDNFEAILDPIEARFKAVMQEALGSDWWPHYTEGLPWYTEVPGELNLPYILRLWSLAKGMDMVDYGKYRYGMIEGGDGGNWMGGTPAIDFSDDAIRSVIPNHPHKDRIPDILREAHSLLHGELKERLSSE